MLQTILRVVGVAVVFAGSACAAPCASSDNAGDCAGLIAFAGARVVRTHAQLLDLALGNAL
jgi:hypothetical protein